MCQYQPSHVQTVLSFSSVTWTFQAPHELAGNAPPTRPCQSVEVHLTMKLNPLTMLHFFLLVVTTSTVVGNPLWIVRSRSHNHIDGLGSKNGQILDQDNELQNSISIDETVSTQNVRQDGRKDWTKITKNPVHSWSTGSGSRVELQCEANGSPSPQILWLRGNNPEKQLREFLNKVTTDINVAYGELEGLGHVVSKLVIDCVTPMDQGLIYCASVSGTKVALSSPTLLLIDGENGNNSCSTELSPTITLHSPVRFAPIGSTVVLPCRAVGKPRPYTFWLDNNSVQVDSSTNPRYKILWNGDLAIDPLEWNDMGSFTCMAKTDDTEESAATFLYPMLDKKKGN